MEFLLLCLALVMDLWLGEPQRRHPLVLLGRTAERIEKSIREKVSQPWSLTLAGCAAVLILLILFVSVPVSAAALPGLGLIFAILIIYFCIAYNSLVEHAMAVFRALEDKDIDAARIAVARIVSRDTRAMNESEIATAAAESILENGNDAVMATIFWYLLAGLPGILVYRIANTLDAMWGYRNSRYRYFGFFAARLDDALNLIPAQLCALSYALAGNGRQAFRCWKKQGLKWKSINAGSVMASGAGSLQIRLGGPAIYNGEIQHRPELGCGSIASAADIKRCLGLVRKSLLIWLLTAAVITVI